MPDLSTTLHTDMLRHSKRKNSLPRRLIKAVLKGSGPWVYGTEWGAISEVPPLAHVLQRWLAPYVESDHVAVEIGPGGGRWTRHMLGFSKLYVVEYYDELLSELKQNFSKYKQIVFIKNDGVDFPGIPPNSVDFCFSFGAFVHFDFPIIEQYLDNIAAIMKPSGQIILHYSDKTKIMARENRDFSDNDPDRMRAAILSRGYKIIEDDTTTLWHSSLVRFSPNR